MMNDYKFYHTIEFIEYCDKTKIIFFDFFAHITHLLQSFDMIMFQSLKHWHAKAVKNAMNYENETFIKMKFLNVFISFRKKTFKTFTILFAWKEVELFSFNFAIILNQLFFIDRFTISELKWNSDWNFNYNAEISKNLTQLMIAAYELKRIYSDSFRLKKFVREIVITVRAERFFEDQLVRTNAIESAKKLKINQNRRSIQKNEIIIVKRCRKMISNKKNEKNRLKIDRKIKWIRQ